MAEFTVNPLQSVVSTRQGDMRNVDAAPASQLPRFGQVFQPGRREAMASPERAAARAETIRAGFSGLVSLSGDTMEKNGSNYWLLNGTVPQCAANYWLRQTPTRNGDQWGLHLVRQSGSGAMKIGVQIAAKKFPSCFGDFNIRSARDIAFALLGPQMVPERTLPGKGRSRNSNATSITVDCNGSIQVGAARAPVRSIRMTLTQANRSGDGRPHLVNGAFVILPEGVRFRIISDAEFQQCTNTTPEGLLAALAQRGAREVQPVAAEILQALRTQKARTLENRNRPKVSKAVRVNLRAPFQVTTSRGTQHSGNEVNVSVSSSGAITVSLITDAIDQRGNRMPPVTLTRANAVRALGGVGEFTRIVSAAIDKRGQTGPSGRGGFKMGGRAAAEDNLQGYLDAADAGMARAPARAGLALAGPMIQQPRVVSTQGAGFRGQGQGMDQVGIPSARAFGAGVAEPDGAGAAALSAAELAADPRVREMVQSAVAQALLQSR